MRLKATEMVARERKMKVMRQVAIEVEQRPRPGRL